jgi:tetratricopeptide (TPR) repeat protein
MTDQAYGAPSRLDTENPLDPIGEKRGSDLEGAIADYSKALRLNPHYAEAFYYRGIARADQGDLEGAIADVEQGAARLAPEDEDFPRLLDELRKQT